MENGAGGAWWEGCLRSGCWMIKGSVKCVTDTKNGADGVTCILISLESCAPWGGGVSAVEGALQFLSITIPPSYPLAHSQEVGGF